MNLHIHHVFSDVDGVSAQAIITAILAGERDATRLAALRDRRCRTPLDKINLHVRGGYVIPWQEPANTTVYRYFLHTHHYCLHACPHHIVLFTGMCSPYSIVYRYSCMINTSHSTSYRYVLIIQYTVYRYVLIIYCTVYRYVLITWYCLQVCTYYIILFTGMYLSHSTVYRYVLITYHCLQVRTYQILLFTGVF